jgi:hypothetical protein
MRARRKVALGKIDLEKSAVEAFQEHWEDVLRRARRGKPLGRKLWRCFEADTNARRKKLAEQFFGVTHARAMARLNPKQIRSKLCCYLPRAIEYAEEEFDDLGGGCKLIRVNGQTRG